MASDAPLESEFSLPDERTITACDGPTDAWRASETAIRPEPLPLVGRRLGQYELLELLGHGGMGTVFRARHVDTGEEVALKVLHPRHVQNGVTLLRFIQEARLVQRIRHPNIVALTSSGQDGELVYLVMELLDGCQLRTWADRNVTLREAVGVLIQVCNALAATERLGIVHRDLKPQNLFVTRRDGHDQVKLLDFGVAKLLDSDPLAPQTAVGNVVGTPAYMSPEQALGKPVDHRSDLYSLGVIMYELVTGIPLFRARSFREYVSCHATQTPLHPRQTRNGGYVPCELGAVIMGCLEKTPSARISSASEVKARLSQVFAEMA